MDRSLVCRRRSRSPRRDRDVAVQRNVKELKTSSNGATGSTATTGCATERQPVAVIVDGFLCPKTTSAHSFWRIPTAALEAQGFRVVLVDPTPVGSMHDRACQIFYELKGGTVCYGQEHSQQHGHDCHGDTFPGTIPHWGPDCPVHIVGYSYGGQTARVLQHLIATGFFSRAGQYRTSSAWVRSVSAIASPLNGCLLVYSLGERADAAPSVRLGSYGHLLSLLIHVVELLDVAILRRAFNPRLEHFGLSWRKLGLSKAVSELLRAVVGDSSIFSRRDNAAFDMTVHSAYHWNQVIETDSNTFYFSVSGTLPNRNSTSTAAIQDPPGTSRIAVCKSEPLAIKLVYWFLGRTHRPQARSHENCVEKLFGVPAVCWSASGTDGVLEGFTQSHPRVPLECEPTVRFGFPTDQTTLTPGMWYCMSCPADHKWALANEARAKATFEKLTRCLLMADNFTTTSSADTVTIGSPSDVHVRRADKGSAESGARLLLQGRGQHPLSKPTNSRSSTCSTTTSEFDETSESDASRYENSGSWTNGSSTSEYKVVTAAREASGAGGCSVCTGLSYSVNGITSLGNFREGGRSILRESFRERRLRKTARGGGGRRIRNARDMSREREDFSRRSGCRCVRLRWSMILLLVLCAVMVVGIFAIVNVG